MRSPSLLALLTPARLLGMSLVLLACAPRADAGGNPMEAKVSLNLGVYAMSSDTRIRLDSVRDDSIGTTLDLEDLFGFDDEDVFRVEGSWRFLPRHKIRLMYFSSDRTSSEELDFDVNFGDETFPANIAIRSDFDFDIIELAYEYEFLRGERYELGGSIGIHNVGFDVGLAVSAQAGSGGASGSIEEKASADAPLPVIGLRGTYKLLDNLYFQAHAQYFQLEFGDYDGSIQDYQAGVLWQFSNHFGVGLAYNLFQTEVDVTSGERFTGKLDWEYDGAQLYFRAGF